MLRPARRLFVRTLISALSLSGVLIVTSMLRAQHGPAVAPSPGVQLDGSTLLPSGWTLSPAGRHLVVGDLPLNAVQSLDSRYLIVANNGLAKPSLSVIDVATWTVKDTTTVAGAWFGLAWNPGGTRLYVSGASENNVQEFAYADGALAPVRTLQLPAGSDETFAGGLAISPDGRTLYVTRLFAQTVTAIDLSSGQAVRTTALPAEPYTCLVSPDGRRLFVSVWGASIVKVFDAQTLVEVDEYTTGEHPSALALSLDGQRLFVACSSSASIWVFDALSGDAIEQISMSLFPEAPPTSTPDSLALSPDGSRLLVANADDNAVAVVDVSNAGRSFVEGFIPTGWYPTGAFFSRDGKQIFVLNGKGLRPSPNPTNESLARRLRGAVSIVPTPDRTTLADYTRRVYAATPYSDAARLSPAGAPFASPIPASVGDTSPIKHVFYVIRENRTYDQILGDVAQGNGEPSLTLFGRDITPNAHRLAQQFVLFDNFYVDADVSYNGHAYSTAAYATDFVEKLWQTRYAGRGGPYLGEGGGFMRNPFGNIAAPMQGYLWDYASRAHVTLRSYGEFARNASTSASGDVVAVETVPGLHGLVAPGYAAFDLDIRDTARVNVWLQEFQQYQQNDNLPQLSIIRLGNDHTAGARPGAQTPRAMLADNDLALGRLVEAISGSVYWKDSAIFVVEDDAQSGPDHVDSHRSVLLVASPFAKRAVVDHTFYSTASVLRTIELVLGLPPMSQYDAAAAPLYNAFQATPALAPYSHAEARVPLDETNLPNAPGSAESLAMDFSDADRTPEVKLNEILWRTMKGALAQMPPPRRSILVRSTAGGDDDRW